MEGDGFLPLTDYDDLMSQEDSQNILANGEVELTTPPKELMATPPPPPSRPKKVAKRISKVSKENENKCLADIQRANMVAGTSSNRCSPSLTYGEAGGSNGVLQSKQLNIFGVSTTLNKYEERDLEAVNVPITNTLFLSYNLKDVTFSTSKKKRIICLQINKKYVSKEGQDRVWNIKIQDDEIDKVLQGLAFLNKEYILKHKK